jgi:hypothetical protein
MPRPGRSIEPAPQGKTSLFCLACSHIGFVLQIFRSATTDSAQLRFSIPAASNAPGDHWRQLQSNTAGAGRFRELLYYEWENARERRNLRPRQHRNAGADPEQTGRRLVDLDRVDSQPPDQIPIRRDQARE